MITKLSIGDRPSYSDEEIAKKVNELVDVVNKLVISDTLGPSKTTSIREARHSRVRVGQVWRDKDPRSPHQVTVLQIKYTGLHPRKVKFWNRNDKSLYKVQIQRHSKKVWVRLDRFIKKFAHVTHTEELH